MSLHQTIRSWVRFLYFLGQNLITLTGAVLTTSSAVTLIAFWFYDFLLPGPPHPYIGILLFLILPGIFVLGLLLIPVGMLLRRSALRTRGELLDIYPAINLREPMVRRGVFLFGAATFVNVLIFGTASYRGVAYMDSTQFCGQTCHTVMTPEFTAYQNSPHSRVECVACHIGPGASWFVRSKLSGVRQVFAVAFNTYPRPIPPPVRNLRPSRETCEACHWPQVYGGDRLKIIPKYAEDEANTATKTVLLLHIGGGKGTQGIHGVHVGPGVRIRYTYSDEKRQTIPWVEYREAGGKTTAYTASGAKGPMPGNLIVREMDCIDCHNRPTHAYELPEPAIDNALAAGSISPALPFAKKTSLSILKAGYHSRADAESRIPAAFERFYR